jgi:hypothetical protein
VAVSRYRYGGKPRLPAFMKSWPVGLLLACSALGYLAMAAAAGVVFKIFMWMIT